MSSDLSPAGLSSFDTLMNRFKSLERKRTVVMVSPTDEPSMQVVSQCASEGWANFILTVGREDAAPVEKLAEKYPGAVEVVLADDLVGSAVAGVALVRQGRGDVLMKGGINTDKLLHAVLDKEHGLLPQGKVMSHLTLTHVASYHKMLMFMDAAVIPAPDFEQFRAMLHYGIDACHKLGVQCPNVALIHFSEKVNKKFQHTLDYTELINLAKEGEFGCATVDGPMDVKTACDRHSAQIKGIDTPVAGNTDLLIFPNLTAGNTFYKTVSFFCDAPMAGVLCGTSAPVVVPSRADHDSSKLYSLALACLLS